MSKIKIFSGESCKLEYSPSHPYLAVLSAKRIIDNIKYRDEAIFISNNPDYVSTLYYYGKSKGVKVELHLNGKSTTLEKLFKDWNRSLDLINNLKIEQ